MTDLATLGAIVIAMKTIEDQLRGHMAEGGKLASLKHLFIGPRTQQTTNDVMPCAFIIPKDGNIDQYAEADYMGKSILTLNLEVQIGAPIIMDSTVNAVANNVLYDLAGNGCLHVFQNFLYCLMFSDSTPSAASFTPGLKMPLKSMPKPSFRFEYDGNFVYIVSDVTIEYMFTYSEICGF